MLRARRWDALVAAVSFLLVTASVQGTGDGRSPGDGKDLLDFIVRVIGDTNGHREGGKVITRRFREEARDRAPTATKPSNRRPIEIFSRDPSLKDKFINHFTGPVTFSAECNKHFYRLYHNTKDCSTPAYYKRCARLLTRLAKSALCSQP
ncbi:hypothetical protein GDO86_011019 [Hymenochirus boettgeri]|uniref:ALK and LTK ligand 1 n=1 Tax=Hymenochirus boettgeri TaxID=247094 RepID=A0A8T2JHX7_9PIPI|nr:hypothetical protein GDO86_011019 [Hymenochirus boettgeri]